MPRFLNNVNLLGNKLQNAVIDPLGSDPGSPVAGQIWFNTGAGGDGQGRLKIKLATRTITLDDQYVTSVGAGTALANSGTALAPILNVQAATGSVPGTMSAADFTKLSGSTALATNNALVQRDGSGGAAFTSVSIANAPSAGTDAVNKNYADSLAAGFDPKGSVVLATTGALPSCVYANGTAGVGATLTASANSALTTTLIDGTAVHTLALGDRVLVKNQASAFQNGIYTVTDLGSGASKWILTRAVDFNTVTAGPGVITSGAFMFVENGANAVTQWIMTTTGAITIGTTGLTFTQFGAAASYTNGNGLSLAGNIFSVNLTGTNTLEFNGTALRAKSSATANQVLLSGGTGVEPAYGALPLGNASAVTGVLGKANGGFGVDTSTGQTQNQFWGSPNGASGALGLRALVNADLPTSGVSANTYTKVTVNDRGIITSATNLAAGDIPSLDFAKITTGIVPLAQGGLGVNSTSYANAPSQARVAAVVMTSNVNITSPGATLDGVTMAAGQRVLLTGQTTASQNGLWIWNAAASAMTRPSDYAAGSTTLAYNGLVVDIAQGTTGLGTSWYVSTVGAITIDTTSVTFTQILWNVGAGITGQLPLANGGTGSGTAAGARSNLNAAGRATGTITGDGTTTSFAINHNLNSAICKAVVMDPTASNEEVYPNIQYNTVNQTTIVFSVAPGNGVTYTVDVIG